MLLKAGIKPLWLQIHRVINKRWGEKGGGGRERREVEGGREGRWREGEKGGGGRERREVEGGREGRWREGGRTEGRELK